MSLLKDIQIFIAENPGLTNKQIAASMPQYDVHAVQRGVCHLVKLNRATRHHNGKCYQYFAKAPGGEIGEGRSALKINRADKPAVPEQEEALNPAVTTMMDKAQGLFEKGLYQRAATVLMDAFNRSKNEEQRMKILIERQRCLSMAPKVKAGEMDLNASAPASSRLSTVHSVSTARSQQRRVSVWRSFTVTSHASNYSAVAVRLAGTTGEINLNHQLLSLYRQLPFP